MEKFSQVTQWDWQIRYRRGLDLMRMYLVLLYLIIIIVFN